MTTAAASPARIAFAGLAAINVAAAIWLAWLITTLRTYDGFMVFETSLCVGLIAALAGVIWGAVALKRRNRMWAALALLCVGAVPAAGFGSFLLYLESNPIDWK